MYKNLKRDLQAAISINEAEFNTVINKTKCIQLEKNETWKPEGKISQELAYVNKGLLRHFYMDNGNEKTEKFYIERSWIGDIGSFLSKTPSLRNYIAIEKTELVVLSFSELQNLYNSFPRMERFGRLYVENLLIEQQNRSRSFKLDSAETRYAKFMVEFPTLQQRIPQYLIAQYIGITSESLSRIRKP